MDKETKDKLRERHQRYPYCERLLSMPTEEQIKEQGLLWENEWLADSYQEIQAVSKCLSKAWKNIDEAGMIFKKCDKAAEETVMWTEFLVMGKILEDLQDRIRNCVMMRESAKHDMRDYKPDTFTYCNRCELPVSDKQRKICWGNPCPVRE